MVGMLCTAAGFLWMAQLDATSTYANGVLGGAVLRPPSGWACRSPRWPWPPPPVSRRTRPGSRPGVLNTSRQVGGSIGLAALATLATARTQHLTRGGSSHGVALTSGYDRAFLVSAVIALVAVARGGRCRFPAIDAHRASQHRAGARTE